MCRRWALFFPRHERSLRCLQSIRTPDLSAEWAAYVGVPLLVTVASLAVAVFWFARSWPMIVAFIVNNVGLKSQSNWAGLYVESPRALVKSTAG